MLDYICMRDIKFSTGEFYHVYNRGVDKRDIFMGLFIQTQVFYIKIGPVNNIIKKYWETNYIFEIHKIESPRTLHAE